MVFDEGAGPSSAINDNENSADTNQRKEREIQVKKPPAPTLLQSYKQNWKPANNHFNRYSDVRPRDERRPTVIDLANQPDVLGRINGWKVHHLGSQLEDMVNFFKVLILKTLPLKRYIFLGFLRDGDTGTTK